MDSDFNESQSGKPFESEILNLKKSKEGNLSKMPVVSEDDFNKLTNYMDKIIKQIGEEIMIGNIKNEPLIRKSATSPCEYCSYKRLCNFEPSLGNKYRRINNLKNEEVLSNI